MKFGDAKRLMRGIQMDEADFVSSDGRPVINLRAHEGKVVVELGESAPAEPTQSVEELRKAMEEPE